MGAPALSLLVKPEEFFRERVSFAIANQQVEVGDDIEFYLVNLLCDFISPAKIEVQSGELNALETPLALMLKEAVDAPPAQRLRIFKYLGDTSLYMAGFFQDYFNRKAFDVGYYISLGSSAYTNVAALVRETNGDQHFTEMFRNLSDKFKSLVEVVAEVSEVPGQENAVDVLAVYDRWTRTHSDRLRRVLNNAGISPLPVSLRHKQ